MYNYYDTVIYLAEEVWVPSIWTVTCEKTSDFKSPDGIPLIDELYLLVRRTQMRSFLYVCFMFLLLVRVKYLNVSSLSSENNFCPSFVGC